MDQDNGGKGTHDKTTEDTRGRDDRGCGRFIHRARGKFFLVVPLVEAEPALLRMRIIDMRGSYSGFTLVDMEKRRITDDLPDLAMAFKIVKGLDREKDPIHRQDKRVESQTMEPFSHWSANLAIKFGVAYPSGIKEWLKKGTEGNRVAGRGQRKARALKGH